MQTSTIWWLAAVGLLWSASGPLTERYNATQALSAQSTVSSLTNQADKVAAKTQRKRSAIALERIKAGCIPVLQGNTQLPLTAGSSVAQPDGSPLSDGSCVANARGDTAIVSTLDNVSTLTSIASAAPADLDTYRQSYDRITQNLGIPSAPTPLPTTTPITTVTES